MSEVSGILVTVVVVFGVLLAFVFRPEPVDLCPSYLERLQLQQSTLSVCLRVQSCNISMDDLRAIAHTEQMIQEHCLVEED